MDSAEKHNSLSVISSENIENRIYFIRGHKVMLDSDLAALYGVHTGRLNEQVKRNTKRFPGDFMFRLTKDEYYNLISQNAISSYGGRRKWPLAFTEQGIAMLSGILNSDRAIAVNIAIMRAFVRIRQLITFNKDLVQKLAEIEHKIGHHDQSINELFAIVGKIFRHDAEPKKKFGFDTGTAE
jgi:hypothetical protein